MNDKTEEIRERCLTCTTHNIVKCSHQDYLAETKRWAAGQQEGDPWLLNW